MIRPSLFSERLVCLVGGGSSPARMKSRRTGFQLHRTPPHGASISSRVNSSAHRLAAVAKVANERGHGDRPRGVASQHGRSGCKSAPKVDPAGFKRIRGLARRSASGPPADSHWTAAVGAKTAYIAPGSPRQNGFIESFNARPRDGRLDEEILYCSQRPGSPSRAGGAIATPSGRLPRWATSASLRRSSTAGQAKPAIFRPSL